MLWIAGALADGSARTVLWLAALAIDYAAPLVTYWVPGRPRLTPDAWEVETAHFAERFQLFIIIALGETIVITGATTAELELDHRHDRRVRARVPRSPRRSGGSTSTSSRRSRERRLALAENRTLLARDAYTYLHVVIVAGILLAAVGDELVIAHPTEELGDAELAAVVAGPALYLLAHVLFRLRMAGTLSGRRLAGAPPASRSARSGRSRRRSSSRRSCSRVLVAVIVGDQLAARHRRQRGEPSPLERVHAAPDAG